MKMNIQTQLKLFASGASLFLSLACAQNSGAPSASVACVQPQDIQAAFQKSISVAPVSGNQSQLIVKMQDFKNDFRNLKSDLLREDPDVQVQKVSHDTASIDLGASSGAKTVLERYIAQNKIINIEADHSTFAFDTQEDSIGEDPMPDNFALSGGPSRAQAQGSGKQIIVAVIDSGVDYTHKDLAPYIWKNSKEISGNGIDDDGNGYVDDVNGWDFVNNDNKPMADDSPAYHGTHVAGIVRMASKMAEKGLNIKIMALKYLNSNSAGRTSNAIRAIDYAIQNGASILNNSWGSFSFSSALAEAIERSRKANILFVAAAGNGDATGRGVNIDQTPFYPAAYQVNNIIAVAAADAKQALVSWSNFGAANVDLGAPGLSIKSTSNGNSYKILSGTSMAAPYVSGVAALLWAQRPDLSYAEIRKVISQSVNKVSSLTGKTLTGGHINSDQAAALVAHYVHDPNDFGSPEISPSGVCSL